MNKRSTEESICENYLYLYKQNERVLLCFYNPPALGTDSSSPAHDRPLTAPEYFCSRFTPIEGGVQ